MLVCNEFGDDCVQVTAMKIMKYIRIYDQIEIFGICLNGRLTPSATFETKEDAAKEIARIGAELSVGTAYMQLTGERLFKYKRTTYGDEISGMAVLPADMVERMRLFSK